MSQCSVLTLWSLITASGVVDKLFLPSPAAVLSAGQQQALVVTEVSQYLESKMQRMRQLCCPMPFWSHNRRRFHG